MNRALVHEQKGATGHRNGRMKSFYPRFLQIEVPSQLLLMFVIKYNPEIRDAVSDHYLCPLSARELSSPPTFSSSIFVFNTARLYFYTTGQEFHWARCFSVTAASSAPYHETDVPENKLLSFPRVGAHEMGMGSELTRLSDVIRNRWSVCDTLWNRKPLDWEEVWSGARLYMSSLHIRYIMTVYMSADKKEM